MNISKETIDNKTIVIIQIPMLKDEDLNEYRWVKWLHTTNSPDFYLKVRQPGRSLPFDEVGIESEVKEYIVNQRSQITTQGRFFDSILDYEEERKRLNTSYQTLYRSYNRIKY